MKMSRTSSRLLWAVVACAAVAVSCSRNPDKAKARHLMAGDTYFKSGKYPEALLEYRRAIQIDARSGPAHARLAKTYAAVRDNTGAYHEWLRAADLLPDDAEAQLQAGQMFLRTREFDGAKQRAMRLLEKDPKNVDAQILLGNALAGLKDLTGAIAQLEKAIDEDPERTLSYSNLGVLQFMQGDRTAAEAAFKRAVSTNPKSVPAHLALANFYWSTQRLDEAEAELLKAFEIEPKSPLTNQALATLYWQTRRPENAEKHLKAYADSSSDVAPKVTLAGYYSSTDRPAQARAVLESLKKTTAGFVPAMLELATLDYADGHRDTAHKNLEAVLQRDPKNLQALLSRARFFLKEGRNGEALSLARSLVSSHAEVAAAHYALGAALEANNEPQAAVDEYKEAVKRSPGTVPAEVALVRLTLSLGDAKAAVQFAREALGLRPQLGGVRLMLAKALIATRSLDAAETELTTLLKAVPSSAEAHAVMGLVQSFKRDSARARQEYTRALELDPASFEALAGAIGLDMDDNKVADARARLERRLASAPTDMRTLLLAGKTYTFIKDWHRAEEALRKAMQVDPSALPVYEGLAQLYIAQKRLDEARMQFDDLVKRQPKQIGPLTMAGMILSIQNRPDEARKRYEQVIAIDPQSPVAANNLAWTYAETGGNLDVALQLARTAVSKAPNQPSFNDTLGWIYYKKGLNDLAISSLKQSVASDPRNPDYLFHLGLAYARKGDKSNAQKTLEQALNLKSDFPGADEARKVLKSVTGKA